MRACTASGAWSVTARIANTDSDENPYDILITGTALAAEMRVARTATITDGGTDTVAGTEAAKGTALVFQVHNEAAGIGLILSGSPKAVIAGQSNCTVSVTQQPASPVAQGVSTSLNVVVTPTAAGAWSFTVSIANNDLDENPYNWTVSGDAAAPAPSALSMLSVVLKGPVPAGAIAVDVDHGSGFAAATLSGADPDRVWSATVPRTATAITVRFTASDGSAKSRTFALDAQ